MSATQIQARRSDRQTTATRPVQETLLELAYMLHATKVVKRLPKEQLVAVKA